MIDIKPKYIVLGGTGFVGSAICTYLEKKGESYLSINSKNYSEYIGTKTEILINCNGNTFRYKANENPSWDFKMSVLSVENTFIDFDYKLYIYISSIDVYNIIDNPQYNHESCSIDPKGLDVYGFHKWISERLVENYTNRSVILRLATIIGNKQKKGPIFDLLNNKPLHMSLNSQLSLINVSTIPKAISKIIKNNPEREIINLSCTGNVSLLDIIKLMKNKAENFIEKNKVKFCYDINNKKIQEIMPIVNSFDEVKMFIESYKKE